MNIAPTTTDKLNAACALLRSWGFAVVQRPGWATKQARGDITFTPRAIINHHTAGNGTSDAMLFDNGNGVVKAPLCHFAVQRDQAGTVTLGAAGYANHAGLNDQPSVAAVLAGPSLLAEVTPSYDDNYSANRCTIGVEVKAATTMTPAQYASTVALNAALVLAFGWSKTRPPVGSHKEITRRKPSDPAEDMAKFRRDVVAFIAAKESAPVAVTPPPVILGQNPTKPAILLGVANCQSYDGDRSAAAWAARGRLMAAQRRNAWVVTETTEAGRKAILAVLGANWKVWTLNGLSVAVLFDGGVFSWRPIRKAGPRTPFGHGSLAVPLWHRLGRFGADVIAHHTRPASIATDAQKDADIAAGARLAGKWPAIFAGDFNRNAPKLDGWNRVTPKVDTMDAGGEQSVDAAFIRGRLVASGARIIDPGPLSDHKWLTVDLAPGADPSL